MFYIYVFLGYQIGLIWYYFRFRFELNSLLHAGVDCLQTAQLTGHENHKSMDVYAPASYAKQKEILMLVRTKHNAANGASCTTNQQHAVAVFRSKQSESEGSDENTSAASSFTDELFANSKLHV